MTENTVDWIRSFAIWICCIGLGVAMVLLGIIIGKHGIEPEIIEIAPIEVVNRVYLINFEKLNNEGTYYLQYCMDGSSVEHCYLETVWAAEAFVQWLNSNYGVENTLKQVTAW